MPSGPGWFWARVSTMKAWFAGTSSPVFGLPSGPTVRRGSSALSGTNTVEPLLTVWSTPWSKNCPKNVNSELYGGERPTSVVTFGMKSVLCDGTQPAGTPSTGGTAVGSGSVVHGVTPTLPCVLTGWPAAATAAGFVFVWSSIRLLMTRGCESTTLVFLDLYDETAFGSAPKGPKGSASLNTGDLAYRGNTWLAAAKFSRVGNRLLHEPSVVRRP